MTNPLGFWYILNEVHGGHRGDPDAQDHSCPCLGIDETSDEDPRRRGGFSTIASYGLIAYLLSVDPIVPPNARLDATPLARIVMSNQCGFVSLKDRNFDGDIDGAHQ